MNTVAHAVCSPMYNLLTNENVFNTLLTPYLKPMAKNIASDALLKQVKADILACKRPSLIYCPRLTSNPNHWPVRLKPSSYGDQWQTAKDTVPSYYHTDVAELFSLVVNSGTSADFSDASTRFRQMFGEGAKTDNAGYFLFKDKMAAKSGWQKRYQGPDFNFLDAFQKRLLVPLNEDPYVKNWITFWAQFNSGASPQEVTDAANYIWVSHSPKLCWSLLLQGMQNSPIPNTNPVAIQADPVDKNVASAVIWKDKCIHKCGPKGQFANAGYACGGRVHCKAQCLRSPTCVGFYLRQTNATDDCIDSGTSCESCPCAGKGRWVENQPADNELANKDGSYSEFIALDRRATGSGIALNTKGTFPLQHARIPMHVYKERPCGNNKTQLLHMLWNNMGCTGPLQPENLVDRPSAQDAYVFMKAACRNFSVPLSLPIQDTLAQCKASGAEACAVDTSPKKLVHQLRNGEWIQNCMREYYRIDEHDPVACRAKCMTDTECLAWTWNNNGCSITTAVGQLTTSSIPADLDVLRELGFDPAIPCNRTDHAFDLCMDQCVHISNAIHQGWCAHRWVNCKAGPFVTKDIPEQSRGKSVCTGGLHPENKQLEGNVITKASSYNDETWGETGGHKFPKTTATAQQRIDVMIGGRKGAYTANRCGDIGASDMKAEHFGAWREWSREYVRTNVDERMSWFFAPHHNWPMRTFVSPAQGSSDTLDGNAYASPAAGITSGADGLSAPITFPKCQFTQATQDDSNVAAQGRVYSYTRGNMCSNKVNTNVRAYYDKSLASLQENPQTPYTGLPGSPFVGATFGAGGGDWGHYNSGLSNLGYSTYSSGGITAIHDMNPDGGENHIICFGGSDTHSPLMNFVHEYNKRTRTSITDFTCSDVSTLATVSNTRFDRVYGDNTHCYMTTIHMNKYVSNAGDATTDYNTLYEWTQNVNCGTDYINVLPSDLQDSSGVPNWLRDGAVPDDRSGSHTEQDTKQWKMYCYNRCIHLCTRAYRCPSQYPHPFHSDNGYICLEESTYGDGSGGHDSKTEYYHRANGPPTSDNDNNQVEYVRCGQSNDASDTTSDSVNEWCGPPEEYCTYCSYRGPQFNMYTSRASGQFEAHDYEYSCRLHRQCNSPTQDTASVEVRRRRGTVPLKGYTWTARFPKEHSSLPSEGMTLTELKDNGALHPKSLSGMHPRQGHIQNAQRAFAANGTRSQSVTYDPPPGKLYRSPQPLKCTLDTAKPKRYPVRIVIYDYPNYENVKSGMYRPQYYNAGTESAPSPAPIETLAHCKLAAQKIFESGNNAQLGYWFIGDGVTHPCITVNNHGWKWRNSRGPDDIYSRPTSNTRRRRGTTDVPTSNTKYHELWQWDCQDNPVLENNWQLREHVYTRNALEELDGASWKAYVATYSTLNSFGNMLPGAQGMDFDINAGNAGMMIPVGVYYGTNPNVPLSSLSGHQNWHPLAQTTMKCPSSKPVRCSKLTIVEVAGGQCEYSSETNDAKHAWSGFKPIENAVEYDAMEKWKSKLGHNTQGHIYDFSCHSIEDDLTTSVCGFEGPGDTALGGARCGRPVLTNDTTQIDGWCGLTDDGLKVNAGEAVCDIWPTGQRTVCPSGMALIWSNNNEAVCVPSVRAEKIDGRARTHLPSTLEVSSDTDEQAVYYLMSSNCKGDEVSSATGQCVKQTCSQRTVSECEAQDLKNGKASCTIVGLNCAPTNTEYLKKGDPAIWWPGFNAVNGSYAGVGPGWVSNLDKCDSTQSSCKGFNLCGATDTLHPDTCLSDVTQQCCKYNGVSSGARQDTCAAIPSTKCGGGKYMFTLEDTLAHRPSCEVQEPYATANVCPKEAPYAFDLAGVKGAGCCASKPVALRSGYVGCFVLTGWSNRNWAHRGSNTNWVSCAAACADYTYYGISRPVPPYDVNHCYCGDTIDSWARSRNCIIPCDTLEPEIGVGGSSGSSSGHEFVVQQMCGGTHSIDVHTHGSGSMLTGCGSAVSVFCKPPSTLAPTPAPTVSSTLSPTPGTWMQELQEHIKQEKTAKAQARAAAQSAIAYEGPISAATPAEFEEALTNAADNPCTNHDVVNDNNMCKCDCTRCMRETYAAHAQSPLIVETSTVAGYTASVQELFLQIMDVNSGNPLRAQGCRGPADRMEGVLWNRQRPSCACVDEPTQIETEGRVLFTRLGTRSSCLSDSACIGYTDTQMLYAHGQESTTSVEFVAGYTQKKSALRKYPCDATTSCAYTYARPGTHGFTRQSNTVYVYGNDMQCRHVPPYMAQMWCISEGDTCTGIVRTTTGKYCLVDQEHIISENEDLVHTWHDTGCLTSDVQGTNADEIYAFCVEALTDGVKAAVCCGTQTCGATLTCIKQDTAVHTYDMYAVRHSSSRAYTWSYKTTGALAGEAYDKYDPFEAYGAVAACTKDDTCIAVGWESSGVAHVYRTASTVASESIVVHALKGETLVQVQCPERVKCVHGTSVLSDGACVCRCHPYFKGAQCDQCTSDNRKSDCRTCKDNFIAGLNNVCVCRKGFDIATGCTKCLPGVSGAFCQIDTCSYTLIETVESNAYNLNNVVVAWNGSTMLYDGIMTAGDGRIPFSMENTFVRQNGKLFWLMAVDSTRIRVKGPIPAKLDAIIHNISGEWLYSIPLRNESKTYEDLMTDTDTWGYVCRLTPDNIVSLPINDGNMQFTCAARCASNPECGSWHWDATRLPVMCKYYTVDHMLAPGANKVQERYSASEFNVNPVTCRSGGPFLAGKMRNLPNKPSLAVPRPEQLLHDNPLWLQGSVVCAFGDDTPFLLSQYRRHLWASGTCEQQVQFAWLYSIPRGVPMDKATVRYEWKHGAVQLPNNFISASPKQCAAVCNATRICRLWLHNGTLCALVNTTQLHNSTHDTFGDIETWGGSIPTFTSYMQNIGVGTCTSQSYYDARVAKNPEDCFRSCLDDPACNSVQYRSLPENTLRAASDTVAKLCHSCSTTSDCATGLTCTPQPPSEFKYIPGCIGIPEPNVKYCTQSSTTFVAADTTERLKPCHTDCDRDGECRKGLLCQDVELATTGNVKGCGTYQTTVVAGVTKYYDVCVDPAVVQDLSTNQPCASSTTSHGTDCTKAVDGDITTMNSITSMLHTTRGDAWVRVDLKHVTANPMVTYYARTCCNAANTGSTLRMFIGTTNNLTQASACGLIQGIVDGARILAPCIGIGSFLWIRTSSPDWLLQIPQFVVHGNRHYTKPTFYDYNCQLFKETQTSAATAADHVSCARRIVSQFVTSNSVDEASTIVQGPYTAAVPAQAALYTTAHSEQACCITCQSYQAWKLAGARCACFQGGQVGGSISNRWVPTYLKAGETCNTLVHLVDWGRRGILESDECLLLSSPPSTQCKEACVKDPQCNVAILDGVYCNLYSCKSNTLAPNSAVQAFVKQGGLIEKNGICVRATHFATPSGACSAGGATVAFNANARLYYGSSHGPDTVPLVPGKNCDGDFYPMMAGSSQGILQVADVELVLNRWKTWPLTLGVAQVQSRSYASTPTTGTAGTLVQGVVSVQGKGDGKMRMHPGIGISDNAGSTFQLTQSFAVVSKDGTCLRQAQLASTLAGVKYSSAQQGRCSELGCVRTSMPTGTLETIQAAYVQQLQACGNTSRSTDYDEPVPVVLYLQPPSPWVSGMYQGLPLFKVATGDGENFQTAFGEQAPPPSPEYVAPAVYETPSPTPSEFVHRENVTCTAKEHCCFAVYQNKQVSQAVRQEAREIPGEPHGAHDSTLESCKTLCARLLLCRVATLVSRTCHMWSLEMEGRLDRTAGTFYVHTLEDRCSPSPDLATLGLETQADAVTIIKQDCCLHTIL